ncbi:MAG: hypothetical protein RL094_304 [Candidatus Parcubacteria bacterium]|jgi:hypothetical protein
MKSKRAGFAMVGVLVLSIAVLTGVTYILKNAGTPNDPVTLVAQAIKGAKSTPSGSGKPPCPKKCVALKAKADAAADAADKANKATEKACERKINPDGSQGDLINKAACDKAIEAGKRARAAAEKASLDYVKCINQNAAWQLCPHSSFPYSWNIDDPDKQCAKLEANLEQQRKWLVASLESYKKCMENPPMRPYCTNPNGSEYERALLDLGFYCPDSARNKPSSSEILSGVRKN